MPRREIDVRRLVTRWSRGETVRRLPRRSGHVHARLVLVLDRSERLKPFWGDQVAVARARASYLGPGALRLLPPAKFQGDPPALAPDERLLVLSDLGFYGRPKTRRRWRRLGRSGGPAPVALVPCPGYRWRGQGAKIWSAIDWSSPQRPVPEPAGGEATAAERVLCLASVAMRLETGLVRRLYGLVPDADLCTEVDLWRHPAVVDSRAIGLVLDPMFARQWRANFLELNGELQRRVVALLAVWHQGLAPEIWAAEVANLIGLGVAPAVLGKTSAELVKRIAALVELGGTGLARDAESFLARFGQWSSEGVWRHDRFREMLARAVAAMQRRDPAQSLPAGDPRDVSG